MRCSYRFTTMLMSQALPAAPFKTPIFGNERPCMNTESFSSNDVGNVDQPFSQTIAPPSIFDALQSLAHALGCSINLTDHRGRRFLKDFYVDDAPAVRRYGVWGFSASGASQLVAWPRGKGRGPNGNRVRSGWGNPKNAQAVADQLSEAATAWCTQYGPVPTPKTKAKKKRK